MAAAAWKVSLVLVGCGGKGVAAMIGMRLLSNTAYDFEVATRGSLRLLELWT